MCSTYTGIESKTTSEGFLECPLFGSVQNCTFSSCILELIKIRQPMIFMDTTKLLRLPNGVVSEV